MVEHELGPAGEFEEGGKRLISVSGRDIGIFRLGGQFYAWHNVCPHQGGPVCQGKARLHKENPYSLGLLQGRR